MEGDVCKPCSQQERISKAIHYCNECEEYICEDCITAHKTTKETENHELIDAEKVKDLLPKSNVLPEQKAADTAECELCSHQKKISKAIHYCQECEEYMCDDCTTTHKTIKATRKHKLIDAENAKDLLRKTTLEPDEKAENIVECQPCSEQKKTSKAIHYCHECGEYICEDCTTAHKTMKATRKHKLIEAENVKDLLQKTAKEADEKAETIVECQPCSEQKKTSKAIHYCHECEEYICEDCTTAHKSMKATRKHKLIDAENVKDLLQKTAKELGEKAENIAECQPCSEQKKTSKAIHYCHECEEYMCDDCTTAHKTMKATRKHKLIDAENVKFLLQKTAKEPDEKEKPGIPVATKVLPDSITLVWEPPTKLGSKDCYQISYKDLSKGQKWKQHPAEYIDPIATFTDLKSRSTYVFRVRIVYEDGEEGPYSPLSAEIQTDASLATKLLEFSTKEENSDSSPAKYELPVTEVAYARNEQAKTRKFEIGMRPKSYVESKTIMLIGATGTGKSTFVDGIINYVLGVTWEDPFRFTIVKLEDEEKKHTHDQALSQTEWITCYTLYPEAGSRLEYTLQIIDTPGFGDTRGLERDQEIVGQIRQLFSDKSKKGVSQIDAVCFLIKAPDARLTPTQRYVFQSIMSLFGKDIEENICSLITFADGNDPPVLAAIKASQLPFGEYFIFNNSGLFASNANLKHGRLSLMFWSMGLSSFDSFFSHLTTMKVKSLQLTKDVLLERYRLEAVVRNLRERLDLGLGMVNTLKQEKIVLEQHKSEIEANKNFIYEVEEEEVVKTKIEGKVTNTKCKDCFFLCHERCIYEDNEQKQYCSAMDRTSGKCRMCPGKCFWRKHFNDAFTYEHFTVKKKKTYAEMQQKYKDASGKELSHRQIVAKNEKQLKALTQTIQDMMSIVRYCNERLSEIALRPNPLSIVEHIDIMIENEKQEHKDGYMERIRVLNEFRKAAEIDKHFTLFTTEANVTLGGMTEEQRDNDIQSVFKRFGSWLKKNIPGFW